MLPKTDEEMPTGALLSIIGALIVFLGSIIQLVSIYLLFQSPYYYISIRFFILLLILSTPYLLAGGLLLLGGFLERTHGTILSLSNVELMITPSVFILFWAFLKEVLFGAQSLIFLILLGGGILGVYGSLQLEPTAVKAYLKTFGKSSLGIVIGIFIAIAAPGYTVAWFPVVAFIVIAFVLAHRRLRKTI